MLGSSPFPAQVFVDAWKGTQRLKEDQEQIRSSSSTYLSPWHFLQLPAFSVVEQAPEHSGQSGWNRFRFDEACHLLGSLTLITRDDLGFSVPPLVHDWARDHQSGDRKAQSWLVTGSILALSSCESFLWQINQVQLRPHIHSFVDVEVSAAFSRGPRDAILGIFLQCGRMLLHMRDDARLTSLLDQIFRESQADLANPLPAVLPFCQLHASNLLNMGRREAGLTLLRRIVELQETTLGRDHPDLLLSQHSRQSIPRSKSLLGGCPARRRGIVDQ